MKHMRSVANICNAGIKMEQMVEASAQACPSVPSNIWSSLHSGFSAWLACNVQYARLDASKIIHNYQYEDWYSDCKTIR